MMAWMTVLTMILVTAVEIIRIYLGIPPMTPLVRFTYVMMLAIYILNYAIILSAFAAEQLSRRRK